MEQPGAATAWDDEVALSDDDASQPGAARADDATLSDDDVSQPGAARADDVEFKVQPAPPMDDATAVRADDAESKVVQPDAAKDDAAARWAAPILARGKKATTFLRGMGDRGCTQCVTCRSRLARLLKPQRPRALTAPGIRPTRPTNADRDRNEPLSTLNLYIRGLPTRNFLEGDLKRLFDRFGTITQVKILDSADDTGIGFVHFREHAGAKRAIEALNRSTLFSQRGGVNRDGAPTQPLVVKFARAGKPKHSNDDRRGGGGDRDNRASAVSPYSPCNYYTLGRCTRGADCRFSHHRSNGLSVAADGFGLPPPLNAHQPPMQPPLPFPPAAGGANGHPEYGVSADQALYDSRHAAAANGAVLNPSLLRGGGDDHLLYDGFIEERRRIVERRLHRLPHTTAADLSPPITGANGAGVAGHRRFASDGRFNRSAAAVSGAEAMLAPPHRRVVSVDAAQRARRANHSALPASYRRDAVDDAYGHRNGANGFLALAPSEAHARRPFGGRSVASDDSFATHAAGDLVSNDGDSALPMEGRGAYGFDHNEVLEGTGSRRVLGDANANVLGSLPPRVGAERKVNAANAEGAAQNEGESEAPPGEEGIASSEQIEGMPHGNDNNSEQKVSGANAAASAPGANVESDADNEGSDTISPLFAASSQDRVVNDVRAQTEPQGNAIAPAPAPGGANGIDAAGAKCWTPTPSENLMLERAAAAAAQAEFEAAYASAPAPPVMQQQQRGGAVGLSNFMQGGGLDGTMSLPVSRRGSRDTTRSLPSQSGQGGPSALEIQRMRRQQRLEEMQRQQEARVNMKRRAENGLPSASSYTPPTRAAIAPAAGRTSRRYDLHHSMAPLPPQQPPLGFADDVSENALREEFGIGGPMAMRRDHFGAEAFDMQGAQYGGRPLPGPHSRSLPVTPGLPRAYDAYEHIGAGATLGAGGAMAASAVPRGYSPPFNGAETNYRYGAPRRLSTDYEDLVGKFDRMTLPRGGGRVGAKGVGVGSYGGIGREVGGAHVGGNGVPGAYGGVGGGRQLSPYARSHGGVGANGVGRLAPLDGLVFEERQQVTHLPALSPAGGGVSSTNLYVSRFPSHWVVGDLEEVFRRFGPIEKTTVTTDDSAPPDRGVGFVHFRDPADAERAVAATHEMTPEGCLYPITVKFANKGSRGASGNPPGLCRFFAEGRCNRGDNCAFIHELPEDHVGRY